MVADFIRVTGTLTPTGGGSPCFISQNFIPGTLGGSNADATDCLARFRAAWVAMAGILPTSMSATFNTTVLGYSLLTEKVDSVFSATSVAGFAGSATGDLLPTQTQGLIRWRTQGVVNGRRVVGRWYIPQPAESFNGSNGNPISSYVTGLGAGVTGLLTAGSTASTPAVWHRKTPTTGGSVWGIVGGQGLSVWAVQRGRR